MPSRWAPLCAQSRTLSLSFRKLRVHVDACGGHRTGRGSVASHVDELPTPRAATVWWGRLRLLSCQSREKLSSPAPAVSRGVAMFDPTGNAVVTEARCKSHRSRCLGEPATPPRGPAAPRPSPCPWDGGHPGRRAPSQHRARVGRRGLAQDRWTGGGSRAASSLLGAAARMLRPLLSLCRFAFPARRSDRW